MRGQTLPFEERGGIISRELWAQAPGPGWTRRPINTLTVSPLSGRPRSPERLQAGWAPTPCTLTAPPPGQDLHMGREVAERVQPATAGPLCRKAAGCVPATAEPRERLGQVSEPWLSREDRGATLSWPQYCSGLVTYTACPAFPAPQPSSSRPLRHGHCAL